MHRGTKVNSDAPKEAMTVWPDAARHLKQALPLHEGVGIHGPKVDVRLSTGDDQVVIHGMKHSSQHRIIGALQRQEP